MHVLLVCFGLGVALGGAMAERKHLQAQSGQVSLRDNFNVSWSLNFTKKTIEFVISAELDYKTGWIMVGLMPKKNSAKPRKMMQARGDAFLLWASKASSKKVHWQITNCHTSKGNLTIQRKPLYSLNGIKMSKVFKAVVSRPFPSADKMTPKHKHTMPCHSMYIFGSMGMQKKANIKWNKFLEETRSDWDDAFNAVPVDFKEEGQTAGKTEDTTEYVVEMARKHWLGVVIGTAACLTVVITGAVYCCTKKKSYQDLYTRRKVTYPFYKGDDTDDDEAKVSFLSSEHT
ncbi:predicted protein [Nematostella vectensis]|uniref:DOMON domain-containing protein n=1 Tax=Nematostella vectensis TaxID=45351 RepID=A7RNC4_NEMVE|nr:uncharacterized protein LOC5519201 [Nematostella vectensis]EDO47116.1 predicted protein [Nematostella vectensis]|eukprot:XP_001639179.1 predicted protein [Nematostella vectensis]